VAALSRGGLLARVMGPDAIADAVTVGMVQWLPLAGEPEANLATARRALAALADQGCDVAMLPELWLCGYRTSTLAGDVASTAEPLEGETAGSIAEVAVATGMMICAGSVPERRDGRIYNTTVLYDRSGTAVLVHRKVHLYGAEAAVFEPGCGYETARLEGLGTVGICICFDGDFPESARALRGGGARVVFHPCAYETATRRWWDLLYPAHALANGQWWLSCNQRGGGPDGFFGDSRIIAPSGEVLARSPARLPSTTAEHGHGPSGSGECGESGESGEPELFVFSLPLSGGLDAAEADSGALWTARRPDGYRSGAPS
jgi:predicted amidohydrolase